MTFEANDDVRPLSAVVYIEARHGSRWTSGSGVIVGNNDVITAAHVILGDRGERPDELLVYPSYDPDETRSNVPFSPLSWSGFNTRDFDPNLDGLIFDGDGLSSSLGGAELDIAHLRFTEDLGSRFGVFHIDFDISGTVPVAVAGYPGRYDTNLMVDLGTVREHSIDWVFLNQGDLEINSGNSGGPIYYLRDGQAFVIALVSTGSAFTQLAGHESWLRQDIPTLRTAQAIQPAPPPTTAPAPTPSDPLINGLTLYELVTAQVVFAYLGRPTVATDFAAGRAAGNVELNSQLQPTSDFLQALFFSAEASALYPQQSSFTATVQAAFNMVGRTATASDLAAYSNWAVSSGLRTFQMPWEIMKIALSTELSLAPEARIAWARLAAVYEAVSLIDSVVPTGRTLTEAELFLFRNAVLGIAANTPSELGEFNRDLAVALQIVQPGALAVPTAELSNLDTQVGLVGVTAPVATPYELY